MSNIYSVFSAPGDPKAEVEIAGLLFALFEKNSYALCRYVRVDDAEPKLGILWPEISTEHKCFYFGQVKARSIHPRTKCPLLIAVVRPSHESYFLTIPTGSIQ
jgi:ATP-dependent DNA helicase 2 subunit 2